MVPGTGVRRVRGGLPGRSGRSGAPGRALPSSSLPCPDGPQPGCPADPGRPPQPSRGSGAPGRALPRWARSHVSGGPGEASPAVPGGTGAPGRALPRWAPSRVSGEASPAVPGVRGPGPGVRRTRGGLPGCPGGQGPRVGPCPDGPPPGCPGRLPRPSRGSGAPGRALPRWAPSRVSGEASQAVPGVRGPGSGPPILQAALPRRAPARVSGGPGESSPAVPGGQGPRPGCPGDTSPALPGVRGPGSGPAPMGPFPGVRGGFPGRPGGQGPRVGPCPEGPRPRCPGPRVGPCPDGPRPGCPGRLPRPSRGSGAPGRALPRWAPSWVSGEASHAVPGSGAPGRALPSSSLPCPAPPRRAPGRAGPPSLPCPDVPRPVPQGPRRLRELRQSASRWPPSEPGHLASPRTRGIWSPSALICYGASRWPGCPGSPDEGSFAPSCPARAPGGRVRSRRRSPPSLGAHQLPGRAQIFLRITRDRVRRTPSWSGGPVVLDRAPRARVARPPPRTLVRWVSPPNLAAQRADCLPGSSQHRTPIDWAHLVRLGMDCLASLGCCFKQRASNPARDRPTRWPAVSRKALPGRAKAKQPGSLRPPSGLTRVERGRVAPGPGKPPPTAVRAPECRRPPPPPPSAFSPAARNDRSVGRPRRSRPAGTPCVPRSGCASAQPPPPRGGGRCPPVPVRPPCPGRSETGTRLTPLQQAQGLALALAHPWLAERSAAAGAPGREDRARVRAPPARRTRPSREGGTRERKGGARAPPRLRNLRERQGGKVKPLPRRNPRPPGTTLGGENRIEVPPRAWTTPESPAVLGRQGGLGEEEPGPAREPQLHPTRAGGWASPGRLARLGAARLETRDSRPRRTDGRRPGGAETPPSLPGTLARRPGRGFRRLARSSRSSGRDRRRRGCPGPEPLREHPSPAWGGGSRAERLETFLESWRLTLKRGSLTGCRAVTPHGRRTGGAAFLPPLLPRQVAKR
ncbi:hypothetical protein NDU88_001370 [Pleurodeles waltl]|uniref:Uncharacterized protein n=1 Tax=Pleurodeles waltl TaxID=8319 RepID=A0AAV7TJW7_PLEWA|nr:hypothetical protein NDU88_001370 [Pleurodeles waltl]